MDGSTGFALVDKLLFVWHTHRASFLITAGLLFIFLRYTAHWRSISRQRVVTKLEQHAPVPATEKQRLPPPSTPKLPTPKTGPKRVTGTKKPHSPPRLDDSPQPLIARIQPLIFYYSLTGTTKIYAERLATIHLPETTPLLAPILHDLAAIDLDDFFTAAPPSPGPATAFFYLLLLPSYDVLDGESPLAVFLAHLRDTHFDFRVDTAPLASLAGYAVFGFGDRGGWPGEEEFCRQAREADRWMARLSAGRRGWALGRGDVSTGDMEERLEEWAGGVKGVMDDIVERGGGLGEVVEGSGGALESEDEEEDDDDELISQPRKTVTKTTIRNARPRRSPPTADLEDLKPPIPVDFTSTKSQPDPNPLPMVPASSLTHAALTKQGYTIIGTHSGVKLCRWTKSALRGRGSCYKYSFYGIASHRCMEATPSLACSNKCVFCWRHGTNPVGTTWRWNVDPPDMVFAGMKEGHYRKIKMMRGVPGVRAERLAEGMKIRHCALSLVGEPIFYPHINGLLGMLHREQISTFLVCNAQHPDHLAALDHVTQLYVSIDASTPEALRRIDRPLYRDYWERFLRCMDILREKRKRQRTVFRLTLVKGFNIEDEAEGYAQLVERACPAFVEVKGVTYCGTASAAGAGLSMKNVPFWTEVVAFGRALEEALQRRGMAYGVAAEHAHSCCLLLGDRERFWREGKWHTWIDYERFFKLWQEGGEFGPEDYVGEATPDWAGWGRGGFDPRDERVDRKGRAKG